jgi:lysine 6-dehydrogenase
MKKIAVLGAGMVGRAIALDLATRFEVTCFDKSEDSLAILHSRNSHIQQKHSDLHFYEEFPEMLEPFDAVVSAVPGFMGYKTLEATIKAGKHVVDISFFPENALTLDAFAKQKNVTAIVDCGVAPGMSNLLLGYENSRMKVKRFDCMVGGLPKVRTKPFEYKAPFSPVDVIEEYTRPARYVKNGHMVVKPALSEPEYVNFERAGTLEAFNTDGLRSIIHTMPHIPFMKEKTLRYPGHIDLIRSLILSGFFSTDEILVEGQKVSPLYFTSALLFKQWKLALDEHEFTIMRVIIQGERDGEESTVEYNLFDEYDSFTMTSSMARTTGYTCTAALNMLAKGLFDQHGVFPPELVGSDSECFQFIMNYLAERKVIYDRLES